MRTAEVLGIELKPHAGGDLKTIVSRVVGATADSEVAKGRVDWRPRPEPWDVEGFLAKMRSRKQIRQADVAERILRAAEDRDWVLKGGTGSEQAEMTVMFGSGKEAFTIFKIVVEGQGAVRWSPLIPNAKPPSAWRGEAGREFLAKLNGILPDLGLSPDGVLRHRQWAKVPLLMLTEERAFSDFMDVLDRLMQVGGR